MRRSPFLPTPALLPGRKVRLRLSPHFSAFQQPYGLKQNRSVPPAMPAAWGSLVKSNVVGCANVAPPVPGSKAAPKRKYLFYPGQIDRVVFRPHKFRAENVTNNPAPLKRKTPNPFSSLPGFKSPVEDPQLQACHSHLSPNSCHEKCRDIFHASPSLALTLFRAGPPSTIHDRSSFAGCSALTIRKPAKRRDPDAFGRSEEKRRIRIAHKARTRSVACLHTLGNAAEMKKVSLPLGPHPCQKRQPTVFYFPEEPFSFRVSTIHTIVPASLVISLFKRLA